MRTIPQLLDASFRRFADRVALQIRRGDEYQRLTYAQVERLSATGARRLRERGAGANVRVALLAENGPQWPMACFGVHRAGAVLVPLDAKCTAGEIANILRRSEATLLLTSKKLLPTAREAAGADGPDVLELDVLLTEDADAAGLPPPRTRPGDLAILSFSSGTTGEPKGIMLSHRNITSNISAAADVVRFGPRDNFLSILPLNHMFEQTVGLLVPIYRGSRITYLRSINPRAIAQEMRLSRATVCIIVPAVARLLHKRVLSRVSQLPVKRRRRFGRIFELCRAAVRLKVPLGRVLLRSLRKQIAPTLRCFVSGGSGLPPDIAEFFAAIGLPILQGYGLTETAPVVACNTLGRHRIGSVGRPLRGVNVRIKPTEGCESPTGEIIVRGPNVMAGYYRAAETTAEVLKDGWLHTGDIGWVDRDGFLYICGRVKDVIISEHGKNIYPDEIEDEINRSALVKEVCVVGHKPSADAHAPENVVALIVANEQAAEALDAETLGQRMREEIRRACEHLAEYKRPRRFAIWEGELPKTTTLKYRKRDIVAELSDDHLRPV